MAKIHEEVVVIKLSKLIKDKEEGSELVATNDICDALQAVAEELEVKPSVIKKAIKVAQKDLWDQVYREFDDLETIVEVSGHAIRQDDLDAQNPNRSGD